MQESKEKWEGKKVTQVYKYWNFQQAKFHFFRILEQLIWNFK